MSAAPIPPLSKANVLSGHRCIRKLWWEVNEPLGQANEGSSRQQRWARRVSEAARSYLPGGIMIEGSPTERCQRTTELLQQGHHVLFGASFGDSDAHVSVDVLRRQGDAFVLTEVKSTTRVKDEHLLDLAVQVAALRRAGLKVSRAELMLLNRECRYPDLSNLFHFEDQTDAVAALARDVPALIQDLRIRLASPNAPNVDPGDQCAEPYECQFTSRCQLKQPEHAVEELYRIGDKASELRAKGYLTIHDLPEAVPLSVIASRQRRAVQRGRVIAEPGLRSALEVFRPPVGYLDFETVQLPIPCWEGCHPYDQVPVQFSFDWDDGSGGLQHDEWIASGSGDPRPGIARALVEACRPAGSIVAYNAGFERMCIELLIEAVPGLAAELRNIHDRLVDLLPVVRGHVYHPDFHGSFSIKQVHPALVGENPYESLKVPNGTAAMDALEALMFERSLSAEARADLRAELLRYCATDTRTMVDVHRKLGELADGTA